MRLVLAAAAVVLVAMPAAVVATHGVNSHASVRDRAAQPASSSGAGSTPSAASTTGRPDAGGSARASASASPASSAGTSGAASAQATPRLTVQFANPCVAPGGLQTIMVQSRPGYVVAYNARYSDGRGGDVHGGAGFSPVNADGSYRSTWAVSPGAPSGPVVVEVGTQSGREQPITTRASFAVAARC
jgi:hypothetical protein